MPKADIMWDAIDIASIFDFERGRENNMASLNDGNIPLVSARKRSQNWTIYNLRQQSIFCFLMLCFLLNTALKAKNMTMLSLLSAKAGIYISLKLMHR